MSKRVVLTLYDATRERRIEIFQRSNGTFGFAYDYWHSDHDPHWCMRSPGSECYADTFDRALAEALARFPWAMESN